MQIFLDSCDISEIDDLNSYGIVDGVTTNPSIIASSGRDMYEVLNDICQIIKTSVSAEVVSTDYEGMLQEGEKLKAIGEQIVIKLPLTWDGLKACSTFSKKGIKTNMTLCFSPAQALLAAKAGATYISPFLGRLDDIGHEGTNLITEICQIYDNYPTLNTQILAASIRGVGHAVEVAKLGADIATLPPKILRSLLSHPLTDKGLDIFLNDWNKAQQGKT